MDKALTKAIYYTNSLSGNVVSEYSYSNKDSFSEIIKSFRNDINIRNVFGSSDNICYQIFQCISESYDDLLLDNLDVLLIITRKDNAIRLIKNQNASNKQVKNVGIIKIDSVLAELNLGNQAKPGSSIPHFLFAIVSIGLILNGLSEKVISF